MRSIRKFWGICIIASMLMVGTAQAATGDFDKFQNWERETGVNHPVHLVIGATSAYLAEKYLPSDWNPFWRGAAALGISYVTGILFTLPDRNFDSGKAWEYVDGAAFIVIRGTF